MERGGGTEGIVWQPTSVSHELIIIIAPLVKQEDEPR
jgi:hypothetical protein